jgi:hypothetical protein
MTFLFSNAHGFSRLFIHLRENAAQNTQAAKLFYPVNTLGFLRACKKEILSTAQINMPQDFRIVCHELLFFSTRSIERARFFLPRSYTLFLNLLNRKKKR